MSIYQNVAQYLNSALLCKLKFKGFAMESIEILDKKKIKQRITRMAYEIVERNFEEKELVLIGIAPRGAQLAGLLEKQIGEIWSGKLTFGTVKIDKNDPFTNKPQLDLKPEEVKNKTILIVDDVVNSGRTIFFAAQSLSGIRLKSIQVAVLVHRSHASFPVKADYIGLSLATTIQEHVNVELSGDSPKAVLS